MLDIKRIRQDRADVERRLARRGQDFELGQIEQIDEHKRTLAARLQELQAERNQLSKQVGQYKREGRDAEDIMQRTRQIGEHIKGLQQQDRELDTRLREFLLRIPNTPDDRVPIGADEADNLVLRHWGQLPDFDFEPRSHDELGTTLGIFDFERGVKIAQSRFSLLKGTAARLERALAHFMLDLHTAEHQYLEVQPPLLVNAQSMTATGQLPKFADDLFHADADDLYLIPTAEVPVTNIHRDEILPADELPLRYTAWTPCFRREAGSYGKDTKGLIRQHQFNKVELVCFSHPDRSDNELETLCSHAERVLQLLELPYRVVCLCGGDLGFSARRTYDIEVWLPSQNCYREISSCSNFGDYQARRAGIRFKDENGKNRLVHTLNGSALAVGRTLVALLENGQDADGGIRIPVALQPYMGGQERIEP